MPLGNTKNRSGLFYSALFDFDIGVRPLREDQVESMGKSLNSYYFYRYRYGTQSSLEKATHGIFETIKSISNIANAMKYLMNKKESKIAHIQNLLINYQADQYWGKDN